MTHRFTLPTELELEELIIQVFENMTSADQSRLSVIESRLLHKAQRKKEINLNKTPWWIVLLLVGGFATAAWWADKLFFEEQNVEITKDLPVSDGNIEARESSMNSTESYKYESENNNESYEDSESPIIYQRESF